MKKSCSYFFIINLPNIHDIAFGNISVAQRSPGRYCKISSWSASYHRRKGTNSGVDAAQRLLRARREFAHLIQSELSSGIHDATTNCERMENKSITRKLYALSGHGVPNGLFRHFTNVARNWLLRLRNNPGGTSSGIGSDDDNRGQRSQQPTSVVETQHQNLHLHSRTSFYSPIPPTLHCWIRIKYSSSIFMVLQ